MKTKIFKNLKELKPYYNKELNTYDFTKFNLVEFEFNLNVKSNIKAMDIKAKNINASNIDAFDIDAWNINAFDIKAMDIKAKNVKCKSIKGKRVNSFHKALDGKIEVLENEK